MAIACLYDGHEALFHRWADVDNYAICVKTFMRQEDIFSLRYHLEETGVLPNTADLKIVHTVKAIIEFPDGSVAMVDPQKIKFCRGEAT